MYQVVGGLDDWQTDTAVCDVMKPFVLTGILTMNFSGGLSGSYEYSGGPFGAAGTGTYEISLPNGPGPAGTMTGTGGGSVDTPLGQFSDSGTEQYTLTPIAPCRHRGVGHCPVRPGGLGEARLDAALEGHMLANSAGTTATA